MKARIADIFESIQGEGLYLGEKQIFVRFYGCNLNCQYCDTRLDRFAEYEVKELLDEIKLHHDHGKFHSISFTGGEPLLQKDFLNVIMALTKKEGYKNYLETNGTLYAELKDVIDRVDVVSMDVKLPSSTGMGPLWSMHYNFLKIASQKEVFIKAVICGSTREEDLREALNMIKEVNKAAVLILQPNSLEDPGILGLKLNKFREICRKEYVTCCTIPQLHKIVGVK
ncbi:MAG: 7-carboxy-7-deazaguanine synthase QueE [Candidatus Omnitrophica bacterium]|nr:7-carboxy-7-deazaguanine synthase QueE [Candidatus Omnitrophota bacterium]